jgi:hypothetical protein
VVGLVDGWVGREEGDACFWGHGGGDGKGLRGCEVLVSPFLFDSLAGLLCRFRQCPVIKGMKGPGYP